MKKVMLFAGLLALGGCSSLPMIGNGGVVEIEESEGIPEWYIESNEDTEEVVFGTGTGSALDLQFAIDKAMHQAKISLGDKLKTVVSSEMKGYTTDSNAEMQKTSKSGYANVDVSKYRVVNKEVYTEKGVYRVYIQLKLKRSDAVVPDMENI